MANSRFTQLAIYMHERGIALEALEGLPKEFYGMPKGASHKLYCEGVLKRKERCKGNRILYGKGVNYSKFMEAFANVSQP
jgi:hypothetical protein